MSDVIVYLQKPLDVVIHEARELRATLDSAERTASPHSSCHQLKCYFFGSADGGIAHTRAWRKKKLTPGRDLLASSSDANNDALAPAFVT